MKELRENHEECGDIKLRKYTRQVKGGLVWFCHNCGKKGFIPNGVYTPSETVKNVISSIMLQADSRLDYVKEVRLPLDYGQSIIPLEGKVWLSKYGITDDEIQKFGIAYSDKYKRLILPVFSDTKLLYWQGRNLGKITKENPKYLNIRQSGAKNVYFKSSNRNIGINSTSLLSNPKNLVVVEDILSAIKVSRYFNCLALLGSYFPLDLLNEFNGYDNIYIYLDSDKWKEAIKAAKKFNMLTGKQFIVKYHKKDPKELLDNELISFLTEV